MRSLLPSLLVSAALALPAAAQTPRVDPPTQQATPVPPENAPTTEGSGSSLSGTLSRSRGVLKPPPTGDAGVLPAPSVGPDSTPVIPPPGTSRDAPVQPKSP